MAIQRYDFFGVYQIGVIRLETPNFPRSCLVTPLETVMGFPLGEAKVYLRGANVTSFTVKGVEWIGLRADCKLDGSKANISGGD